MERRQDRKQTTALSVFSSQCMIRTSMNIPFYCIKDKLVWTWWKLNKFLSALFRGTHLTNEFLLFLDFQRLILFQAENICFPPPVALAQSSLKSVWIALLTSKTFRSSPIPSVVYYFIVKYHRTGNICFKLFFLSFVTLGKIKHNKNNKQPPKNINLVTKQKPSKKPHLTPSQTNPQTNRPKQNQPEIKMLCKIHGSRSDTKHLWVLVIRSAFQNS